MKTILTAAVMLLSFAAIASPKKGELTMKEVSIDGKFQKISVDQNIKLVLVADDKNPGVTITGNGDLVNKVQFKVVKNELVISTSKTFWPGSVTVYISASDLSAVELKSGASVYSQGIINNKQLDVIMNDNCNVKLLSSGKVEVKEAPGCDVVFEKFERSKMVI